jgi:hypothetical protein
MLEERFAVAKKYLDDAWFLNRSTNPRDAFMNIVEQKEKNLAKTVAILVEEIHRSFPNVSTRPIPPYEDEDFTLEVNIPEQLERETVMNECIRHALRVEDQFGFSILTRVKKA